MVLKPESAFRVVYALVARSANIPVITLVAAVLIGMRMPSVPRLIVGTRLATCRPSGWLDAVADGATTALSVPEGWVVFVASRSSKAGRDEEVNGACMVIHFDVAVPSQVVFGVLGCQVAQESSDETEIPPVEGLAARASHSIRDSH